MSTSSEVLMSVSGLQESVAVSPSLVKLTRVSLQLNSSNSTSSDFLVYIYIYIYTAAVGSIDTDTIILPGFKLRPWLKHGGSEQSVSYEGLMTALCVV